MVALDVLVYYFLTPSTVKLVTKRCTEEHYSCINTV